MYPFNSSIASGSSNPSPAVLLQTAPVASENSNAPVDLNTRIQVQTTALEKQTGEFQNKEFTLLNFLENRQQPPAKSGGTWADICPTKILKEIISPKPTDEGFQDAKEKKEFWNSLQEIYSKCIEEEDFLEDPNEQLEREFQKIENYLERQQDFSFFMPPRNISKLFFEDSYNRLLNFSVKYKKLCLAKFFLTRPGIDINKADSDRWIPLHVTCFFGCLEIAKLLLAHPEIDINKEDIDTSTPLHHACTIGNLEIVELLLDHPAININKLSYDKSTPLYLACDQGHLEIVKLLLAHPEIDINQKGWNGCTPLYGACDRGHLEIVKLLLDDPRIEINKKNHESRTALISAEEPSIVRLLLERSDINISLSELEKVSSIINLKRILSDPKAIFTQEEMDDAQLENDQQINNHQNDMSNFRFEQRELLQRFFVDPEGVREEFRAEIAEIDAPSNAASLFALTIFHCNNYMTLVQANPLPEKISQDEFLEIQRFFTMAARLSIELQMVLCNEAYGLQEDIIPHADRELAFSNLANDRPLWLPQQNIPN